MMNKKINLRNMFVLTTFFFLGCGSKEIESASTAQINGFDLSGAWRMIGVECRDKNSGSITSLATLGTGSDLTTEVINGNIITSSTLTASSCKITLKTSLVATLSEGYTNYGIINYDSFNAETSTGGTCTSYLKFDTASGYPAVTPSTISTPYYDGESIGASDSEFFFNPPYLAYPTLLQVSGRPTDICFMVYQKL